MTMIKQKGPGLSLIVRMATRLSVGFIMLYGIYIFTNEDVTPGGGFAGGIILALAFICIMLAYGKDLALTSVPQNFLAFLGSHGVFLLLSVTLLLFSGAYFYTNIFGDGRLFNGHGGWGVSLTFLATSMKVAAGISAIFIVLALLRARRESKP
jgi:multisubunit Na+/H+ antiporter MnhB subunit